MASGTEDKTELVTMRSLGTLGGATLGVNVVGLVINFLMNGEADVRLLRWVTFATSLVLAYAFLMRGQWKDPRRWIATTLNGALIFASASGLNTMHSYAQANAKPAQVTEGEIPREPVQGGLLPDLPVPNWWPDPNAEREITVLATEKEQLVVEKVQLTTENKEVKETNVTLGISLSKASGLPDSLAGQPSDPTLKESLAANLTIDSCLRLWQIDPGVTVTYYPKDLDDRKLLLALESLGYAIHTGKPKNDRATNALWFGSDVSLKDQKIVALALLRAGVDLRSILYFNKPERKPRIMQIGHNPATIDDDLYSVKRVIETPSFPRDMEVSVAAR